MHDVLDDYFEWLYSLAIYDVDGWGYGKLIGMFILCVL